MLSQLLPLVVDTLRSPKSAASRIFGLQFERNTLWSALALVAVVSVLLTKVTLAFVPPEMVNNEGPLPGSPIILTLVIWGLLVLSVFGTYYVGRAFDGIGSLDTSLMTTVWMQAIMLVLQLGQIVLFIVSPILAVLAGYVAALYVFWVFLNFVQVMHGFKSLGMVFAGTIVSIFGLLFGLSLVIGLIAALFGLELTGNV